MNTLLIELIFLLVCYSNGFEEENLYLNKEAMDLETLPLEKLLEMKKALRKQDYPAKRTASAAAETGENDAATAKKSMPNAMALRRTAVQTDQQESSTGGPVQTAFQMSLTVLSFLAFGGYVITLVAQNMRKPRPNGGMTAPLPLKTVIVNQSKRPASVPRPSGPVTSVSYGRRKRSRRFAT